MNIPRPFLSHFNSNVLSVLWPCFQFHSEKEINEKKTSTSPITRPTQQSALCCFCPIKVDETFVLLSHFFFLHLHFVLFCPSEDIPETLSCIISLQTYLLLSLVSSQLQNHLWALSQQNTLQELPVPGVSDSLPPILLWDDSNQVLLLLASPN